MNWLTLIALRKSCSLNDLWPLTSHLSHRVKLNWSFITVATGAAGSEKTMEGSAKLRKQFLRFSLGCPITTLTNSMLTWSQARTFWWTAYWDRPIMVHVHTAYQASYGCGCCGDGRHNPPGYQFGLESIDWLYTVHDCSQVLCDRQEVKYHK